MPNACLPLTEPQLVAFVLSLAVTIPLMSPLWFAVSTINSKPNTTASSHLQLFHVGSNGQDYPSQCHLERVACERRLLDLSVTYAGKCNPCQGFECQNPQQECHVELETRTPVCTCEKTCANETAPVCASNGKTVRF